MPLIQGSLRLAAALALCALTTTDAARAAEPSPQLCFARRYDAGHLARHPHQRVEAISLARSGEAGWDLSLRIGGERFAGSASCGRGRCTIEGDGGAFALRPVGRALELRVGERLVLEGARRFSPDLGASADDSVFRLQPAPPAACVLARS